MSHACATGIPASEPPAHWQTKPVRPSSRPAGPPSGDGFFDADERRRGIVACRIGNLENSAYTNGVTVQ